jgi:hypothetical protein
VEGPASRGQLGDARGLVRLGVQLEDQGPVVLVVVDRPDLVVFSGCLP